MRDGQRVAVDVFGGRLAGLFLAEIDRGSGPDRGLPAGFDAVAEVTLEEAFTGAALAGHLARICERRSLLSSDGPPETSVAVWAGGVVHRRRQRSSMRA